MLKTILALFLFCDLGLAASVPPTIQSVGAFTIYTSQDMKILADWYDKFGFDMHLKNGVYWGAIKAQSGPPYIGIHPKKTDSPNRDSKNISIVFHVNDFKSYVSNLENHGLKADSIESDKTGQFAYYKDPDGNEMTIWGE